MRTRTRFRTRTRAGGKPPTWWAWIPHVRCARSQFSSQVSPDQDLDPESDPDFDQAPVLDTRYTEWDRPSDQDLDLDHVWDQDLDQDKWDQVAGQDQLAFAIITLVILMSSPSGPLP